MVKNSLFRSLDFLLVWVLVLLVGLGGFKLVQPSAIQAQTYTVEVDEADKAAYYSAIKDCSTPSLECLVHYVWTYTAIESCNRILGTEGGCTMSSGGTSTSYVNPDDRSRGGFVPGLTYLIGQMYGHPPAQTGPFIADLMENARLAPPAYAQGLGFTSLNPILNLWKIFRNLAYVFFVFLFVIIGFMIMFRKKIGGQTAITAQQAIPSIIISMIFVTFSYAIAGFMIDLMYLSMFMIIGLFETQAGFQDNIISFNIIQLMIKLFQGPVAIDFTSGLVETFLIGLTGSTAGSQIIGFIGGLTLSLVIAVAVLIGTFRLFFELLRAYASIILNIVTAPITLMMGAIPGKNVFTPWLKKVVGNLLPFPTVLVVIVMFYYFTAPVTDPNSVNSAGAGFVPPFLLGRGQANTMTALMGLAIMLALPDIVKKVRESVAGTGGIGEEIMGWGLAAAKQGWKGNGKIPGVGTVFGKAAKVGAKVGLGAAAGGAVGAIYGAKYGIAGKTGAGGALRGGAIGALATPPALVFGPKIIRGVSKLGKNVEHLGAGAATVQSVLSYAPVFLSSGMFRGGGGTPPPAPGTSASTGASTHSRRRGGRP